MPGSANGIGLPNFNLLPDLSYHETIYDKDEIVGDRYYILEKTEGFANVFFCLDLWDNSPCVLKEIPAYSGKEARNIAKIPFHKNVVQLLRLEVIGGSIFMVLEWLPDTLFDLIKKSQFSANEITDAIFSICCGLQHCISYLSTEEKAYVHKDIKPENVFYDGTFKLADFGGGYTPPYAAPEVENGLNADCRSDIFSIGKILQELCTHCEDKAFNEKVQPLINACTQSSPEKRPQSLQEVCLALGRRLVDENAQYHLTAIQLRNLAYIGEPYESMFHDLTEIWKYGDAESLYYAGDVLLRIDLPREALPMYFKSLNSGGKDNQSIALTKIAQTYFKLQDWDNVIKHSKIALNCMARDYMEKKAPFNYGVIHTYINAVFNKYIDSSPNGANKELFSWIIQILEWLHENQPNRKESLRLLGYIHYTLREYDEAIPYYEEYFSSSKDDYETSFYYAMSLFFTRDTTKAKKQFEFVAEFLETSESTSLGRLIMLLYCKYFMKDADGFADSLKRFDDKIDPLSDKEPKKTWSELMQEEEHRLDLSKFVIVSQLFENDIQLTSSYFDDISITMNALNSEQLQITEYNKLWCKNQFLKIKELRSEWGMLELPSISIALRHLNFLSYHCESLIYERLGNYKAMLRACDDMLRFDKSSPEALSHKAEALVRLERYIDSVPFYQQSFDIQHKDEVKRREREVLFYLHENPDEFYTKLLEEAPSWGIDPSKLKFYISNYRIMFSDILPDWLYGYTETIIQDFNSVRSLLCLLRLLQHLNAPEDKEIRLVNFQEVALHILNRLIEEYAQRQDRLFYLLPIRGNNYMDLNLDMAVDDFKRFLKLKISWEPHEFPVVAPVYHNLAITYSKFPEDKFLELADANYDMAITIYNVLGDKASIAKVYHNKSICFFKEKRYSEAGSAMLRSLDYITADKYPILYSQAQYILGNVISIFLDECQYSDDVKNMLNKGIEAFLMCVQLYNKRTHCINETDDSCERYFSFIRLSKLYQRKAELFHDGSLVLARYYEKKAKKSLPKRSEVRDFLGQSISH